MKLFGVYLPAAALGFREVQAVVGHIAAFLIAPQVDKWCGALAALIVRVADDWLGSATSHAHLQGALGIFLFCAAYLPMMILLLRRVASGLPLSSSSWKSFRVSDDARNVRRHSKVAERLFCHLKVQRPVAVVTGGNGGIGWWNAYELALMGFDVMLCCRSRQRGEEAIASMLSQFHNDDLQIAKHNERHGTHPNPFVGNRTPGSLTYVHLDMEDEKSIRKAVADIVFRTKRVALIINNAGMFSPVLDKACSFGDERLMGVNFSGLVLFTELLLRELITTTPDNADAEIRVVNVASVAHLWAREPDGRDPAELLKACLAPSKVLPVTWNTYGQSKLCVMMYTRAMATRLQRTYGKGHRVTMVSVHPGAVLTDVFRELGLVAKLMPLTLRTIFKTAPEGAETTLFAALCDDVVGGSFYADCQRMDAATSPWFHDDAMCAEILCAIRDRWGFTETKLW